MPRPLATCPFRTQPQRYYAGSDSYPARTRRAGLYASFVSPSEHPTPNHVVGPSVAFAVVSTRPAGRTDPGFAMSEQARRTTPPKRVRHPAGCSFASSCSPPRLATTQLLSATCVTTSHRLDFHLPDKTTSRTHSLRRRRDCSRPARASPVCGGSRRAGLLSLRCARMAEVHARAAGVLEQPCLVLPRAFAVAAG